MAEEQVQEVATEEEPQGEARKPTDWKAEARKWEALAKKGKAAEDELAKLKEAQMTEQEKANARAEKAEAELAEMKAEQKRLFDAREIAAKHAVPVQLLEFCTDADAMERFCEAYREAQKPVHAAAGPIPFRVDRGAPKADNADIFADFLEQQLKH